MHGKTAIYTAVASAALALALANGLSAPSVVTGPIAGPVAGEYIVHWPEGTARALGAVEGVTVLSAPSSDELAKLGAWVIRVDDAAALDAIIDAGAEYVEPNVAFTIRDTRRDSGAAAADPLAPQQWFHNTVGSARAWLSSTGAGVRVAVVDSGVGPHPDIPVIAGRDFTGEGPVGGSDVFGHGTHVAGICCARRDNGIGGVGVAPGASVISARVLGSNGYGSNDGIAAGIVWATDQGAQVINLSLGGPTATRSIREALAYAVARGVLPVCAAGNDGTTRPDYPAAFEDCLSVAATDRGDMPATFTNRHASIDIAAPGVDVLSACRGDTYCRMDGTSMAAPVVTGGAALVLALSPLSPAALSWRLRSTAVSRPGVPGGRRIDTAAAVAASLRPTGAPLPPTLAPRPTAPASPRPAPTAGPTRELRMIPVPIPPGCHLIMVCDPYPAPSP